MYIKDMTTGKVHKYGDDQHDSLIISNDGRTLSYYNLHNGDGSRHGEYRFCDDCGNVPSEEWHDDYFNIVGFGDR